MSFSVSGFKPRNHRRVKDKTQVIYAENVRKAVMDAPRQFKNPPGIREYWRLTKQKQRARGKTKDEE
ncbi:MAG: hypothetical protein ABSF44_09710 [Candidatus Bathyarchaeia archaeon]|jgi:hypothetical protein